MKIERGASILDGYDPREFRFASAYPSDAYLRAVDSDPLLSAVLSGLVSPDEAQGVLGAAPSLLNALAVTRQTVAWDAVSDVAGSLGRGLMLPTLPNAENLFASIGSLLSGDMADSFEDIAIDAVRTVAQDVILPAVLDEVDKAVGMVASSVPIVGAIVKFGVFLAKMLTAAIRSTREKPPKPGQALVYSRDIDEGISSRLLDASKLDDWTRIFMPVRTDPWSAVRVTWTPGGDGEGYKYGPGAGGEIIPGQDMRFACVPGCELMLSLMQQPDRLSGSGRDAEPLNASTGTSLFPASSQAGAVLWRRVMTPGPRMFSVDTLAMLSAWADYFSEGFAFLKSIDQDKRRDRVLARSVAYHCAWAFNPCTPDDGVIPGVTSKDMQRAYASCDRKSGVVTRWPVKLADVDDRYFIREDGPYAPLSMTGWVGYTREVWERRAARALRTIVCAYVADDAPGLRGNRFLQEIHADSRRELLRHRARVDVELSMIPDREYRQAMAHAKDPSNWIGASDGKPTKDPAYGLARVLPEPDGRPPPRPPTGGPGDAPSVGGGASSGGAGAGLAAGVAAAVILGLIARFR